MNRTEMIGLGALILMFILCGLILIYTIQPAGTNRGGVEDSVIIQQRIKNLEKSR